MKKLLTILFLLFFTIYIHAQELVVDSTRFVTGKQVGTDIFNAIPTADKGILFVGYDYGNPGYPIPYFFDTSYDGNVLIGKIDSNHQISWMKVYGGGENDGAVGACQTPDGGYAVLAGTGSDNGDVTGFLGATDIWLLRIDASGNLLWEKCYGSSEQDGPLSIANTSDHGFIMLGNTYGSDDDVPFHYGDWMTADWLVIKTDSMGNVQWSKDLGGTGDEYPGGAILPVGNSYYLAGSSSSTDHDCTDTVWHAGAQTGYDYYILKLDSTGTVVWDSSYGSSSDDELSTALYDTRDSTLMLMGTANTGDYMVTGYHGCDRGDMWAIKVNEAGTLVWEKALGSIQMETGTGICISPNGYMCYGQTFVYYCKDSTIGDIGAQDCWVFSLDNAGNIITDKIFGGTDVEDPYAIAPYLNGFVATGSSGSSVFTEGSCNVNYSGGFVSYIGYWPLAVNNIQKAKESLVVYPNPTQNNINISLPAANGRLSIISSIGQQVYASQINANTAIEEVQVNEWVTGIYLIIWQGADGNVLTEKFIKE